MLRVSVIGNLGNDPELRYSSQGNAMLTFNVASNGRERRADGEWQDRTEWVRMRVLGKRAESLANLPSKGSRLYADGRLEARPWTMREGEIRAGLELLAETVEFMSPRSDLSVGDEEIKRSGTAARPERQPVAAGVGRTSRTAPAEDVSYLDDLPF
jgi:single-strand DNA-binding protein